MVGIGTSLKIGGFLIAGLIGYTLIKNAGNIGNSVGGFFGKGLTDLGTGITDSFSSAFNIFGGSASIIPDVRDVIDIIPTIDDLFSSDPTVPTVPIVPSTPDTPIAVGFREFIDAGAITREFAEKFSFVPPAQTGQLDVSTTFAYLAQPDTQENYQRRSESNFGGYGSSINQKTALASAIAESQALYPEYFA